MLSLLHSQMDCWWWRKLELPPWLNCVASLTKFKCSTVNYTFVSRISKTFKTFKYFYVSIIIMKYARYAYILYKVVWFNRLINEILLIRQDSHMFYIMLPWKLSFWALQNFDWKLRNQKPFVYKLHNDGHKKESYTVNKSRYTNAYK